MSDQRGRQVRRQGNPPQTLADLTHALQEERQNIPVARINPAIALMRRRCQDVVNANDSFTRYWKTCLFVLVLRLA